MPFLPFAFDLGSIHGKLQLSLQGIVQPVLATKFQHPPTTRARPFQIHAFHRLSIDPTLLKVPTAEGPKFVKIHNVQDLNR